ncbi:MAG TPA: cytochrome c oxidase subunit 3 [Candidatus Didemnitutus sp.]|nr:cytochrome c oxidase subunit 3 [Candidatus Didemnitutus sp.]
MKATVSVPLPYADAAQRDRAGQLGLWTFLATEVLFFGGLFGSYVVLRHAYPVAFAAGSSHLSFAIGTTNTLVLLTSSLTMVCAVVFAEAGRRLAARASMGATVALGTAFLILKAIEYHDKYVEHFVPGSSFQAAPGEPPQVQLFFFLYFALTGLHALHMLIGIGVVLWNERRVAHAVADTPIGLSTELVGLYWHFVDCIWVFLYPLLYLVARP